MSSEIKNGHRKEVQFGSYSGLAGVVERNGKTEVAFFASYRDLRDLTAGRIDGVLHRVHSVEKSETVADMLVLTVTAVTESE